MTICITQVQAVFPDAPPVREQVLVIGFAEPGQAMPPSMVAAVLRAQAADLLRCVRQLEAT